MSVIRITDSSGATYYDDATGSHLEKRKSEQENWDGWPPKVQQAWIETWTEEATGDSVTGVDGLALITTFLKDNKRRSMTSDTARRVLLVEVLSVPLSEAKAEKYTIEKSSKQVDLITAVRDVLGVPLATMATWAAGANADVVKEIRARAEAEKGSKVKATATT
jgi:hypothetical protein